MMDNFSAKIKKYFNSFLNAFKNNEIMKSSKVYDNSEMPDIEQHAAEVVAEAEAVAVAVDADRNAPNMSKKSVYTGPLT